jgi:phenylacetate-CoA ligase
MKIDFSTLPLAPHAFSETPMTFCSTDHKRILSSIMDILLIETGHRVARENWQAAQLRNLLTHAENRSAFWRKRIAPRKVHKDIRLSALPPLSRSELREQVAREGSLLPSSGPEPTKKHATSGSSGTPVEFFVTRMNGVYNSVRGVAQFFIDGRDLSLNSVRFRSGPVDDPRGFSVSAKHSMHDLPGFLAGGLQKRITFTRPDLPALCKELHRDSAGYMISPPGPVAMLLQFAGAEFFREIGVDSWVAFGGHPFPQLRDALETVKIPTHANYSCEEVGMIAQECHTTPDFYHVCTSNVIVEIDATAPVDLAGAPAGRVLVTHLHSYATPFIRYDVGDIATLRDACPCGYQGPVLTNIYGRSKQLLKHADGRLAPFYVPGSEMLRIADINEFRIRQTELRTLTVELAVPTHLPPSKIDACRQLIQTYAGEDFDIQISQMPEIDWGRDTKRLGFRNDLLAH